MARQSLQKIYADFRQGWVDVASPLQQPEGTVKDIVNFDINTDGTLSKRGGLQVTGVESDAQSWYDFSDTSDKRKPSFFIWDNVANDVNRKFLVVSFGTNIYRFYDISAGILDFSESIGFVSPVRNGLATFDPSFDVKPDYVSALGELFIVSPTHSPARISYDPDTGQFDSVTKSLEVRDTTVWQGPSERDTGIYRVTDQNITHWHYFNLVNAGWPESANVANGRKGDDGIRTKTNPISWTKEKLDFYPEIAIPYYSARNGVGESVDTQNAYSPWLVENNYFGNSEPPVGKNITRVSKFRRGGSFLVNPQRFERYEIEYRTSEQPSTISFYAGRLWYGDNSYYSDPFIVKNTIGPKEEKPLSGGARIYYSQSISNDLEKMNKCYQQNDPTVEDLNQLLDTDGGVIYIKESGNIKKLVPLGTSLFVFAEKGVWRIAGADFNSFTPTSFTVDKISDVEVLSGDLVEATKNRIYMLGKEGLFSLDYNGTVGDVQLNDLSTPLIENYFDKISSTVLRESFVRFDDDEKVLYCFIGQPDAEGNVSSFNIKDVLLYKETLNAFYKYEMSYPDTYKLSDALYGLDSSIVPVREVITDSSEVPITLDGELVFLEEDFDVRTANAFINMVFLDYDSETNQSKLVPATFSDKTNFLDFGSAPYEATTQIGFDSNSDLVNDRKQAPYITSFLSKPEQTVFEQYDFTNETVLPEEVILKSSFFFDPSDPVTTRCNPFANESSRATADGEGVPILLDKSRNLELGEELVTSLESGRMDSTAVAGQNNSLNYGVDEPAPLNEEGVTTNWIDLYAETGLDSVVVKVEIKNNPDKRVWIESWDLENPPTGTYRRDNLSTDSSQDHLSEDYMAFFDPSPSKIFRFSSTGGEISVKVLKGNHLVESFMALSPTFDRDNFKVYTLGIEPDGRRYLEGRRGLFTNTALSQDAFTLLPEDRVPESEPWNVWASLELQDFPIEDKEESEKDFDDLYQTSQFVWKVGGYISNMIAGFRFYRLLPDGETIVMKSRRNSTAEDELSSTILKKGSGFVDTFLSLGDGLIYNYINNEKVQEYDEIQSFPSLSRIFTGFLLYYTRTPKIFALLGGAADYTEAEKRTLTRYFAGLSKADLSTDQYEIVGYIPKPEVSCKLSYSWDWDSNFSSDQELYRYNRLFVPEVAGEEYVYPKDVITNKSRVRGRGTALNMRLTSEAGKACELEGLGVIYTG